MIIQVYLYITSFHVSPSNHYDTYHKAQIIIRKQYLQGFVAILNMKITTFWLSGQVDNYDKEKFMHINLFENEHIDMGLQ